MVSERSTRPIITSSIHHVSHQLIYIIILIDTYYLTINKKHALPKAEHAKILFTMVLHRSKLNNKNIWA